MSRVVVLDSVTLDGVMAGAGASRRRHPRGVRARGVGDSVRRRRRDAGDGGAHLGPEGLPVRTTQLRGHPRALELVPDSPFAEPLNNAPKYVASTSTEPLRWPNSTRLTGDVPIAVAELKREPGGDLNIMGSGVLIRSLLPHGLIDEFMLMITPIVLGTGRRLFEDAPRTALRLVDSQVTTTGVVIATYQPTESAASGEADGDGRES